MKNKKYIVPYIPLGSTLDHMELDAIKQLIYSNETLSCGEQRDLFEKEFADFIGVKYALSLTNCTVALEFATYLISFQEGDEVITTPLTYQATAQSLLTAPVKVKFCDIDENNLSIDIEQLKKLITPKTRAIYLTHYGGLMCNMEKVMEIANAHNIIVVEDCAHAHGSMAHGKRAGSTAHISCFSFQSYKNMTTLGEGGIIAFNNNQWNDIIKNIRANEPDAQFVNDDIKFSNFRHPSRSIEYHQKNSYTHNCLGIKHCGTNSTLSESACTVGRVQLSRLEEFNSKRNYIAQRYNKALSVLDDVKLQVVPKDYVHSYHLYTFFLSDESTVDRDELIERINNAGIEIVQRYFPNHLLPEWRYLGNSFGDCPKAERIWFTKMINLPIYPQMTESQVDTVIDIVSKCILECSAEKRL